ncbi:hypothetical protein Tco_1116068, partial [Tanacetum coccineum]
EVVGVTSVSLVVKISGNGSGVSWDGGSAAEMGVSSDIF